MPDVARSLGRSVRIFEPEVEQMCPGAGRDSSTGLGSGLRDREELEAHPVENQHGLAAPEAEHSHTGVGTTQMNVRNVGRESGRCENDVLGCSDLCLERRHSSEASLPSRAHHDRPVVPIIADSRRDGARAHGLTRRFAPRWSAPGMFAVTSSAKREGSYDAPCGTLPRAMAAGAHRCRQGDPHTRR